MISLFDLIGFADLNKIDYNTGINDIIEAYEALAKVKKAPKKESEGIIQDHVPYDSSKWTKENSQGGLDPKAEKVNLDLKREKLLREYQSCCFFCRARIGKNIEKILEENCAFFHADNVILLNEDVTYIGTMESKQKSGRAIEANVYVDNTLGPDYVELNWYEEELGTLQALLRAFNPLIEVGYNVCR